MDESNINLHEIIDEKEYQELAKIAEQQGISLNWAINIAINRFINTYKNSDIYIPDPCV